MLQNITTLYAEGQTEIFPATSQIMLIRRFLVFKGEFLLAPGVNCSSGPPDNFDILKCWNILILWPLTPIQTFWYMYHILFLF